MYRRNIVTRLWGAGRLLLSAERQVTLPGARLLPTLAPAALALQPHTFHAAGSTVLAANVGEAVGDKVSADVTSAVASAGDGFQPAAPPAVDEPIDKLEPNQLTTEDFTALADVYIGGLWMRLERGLREAGGEDFDYEVKQERGGMLLLLPYDGQLAVRKDPQNMVLVVENNLYEPFEDKDCITFRPTGATTWVNEDDQTLEDFVSKALGKYLQAEVKV